MVERASGFEAENVLRSESCADAGELGGLVCDCVCACGCAARELDRDKNVDIDSTRNLMLANICGASRID